MPSNQRGFTLIEITIAILLLAGSLVVLMGLQFSTIEQTVRDQNRETALLAGRMIFAQIEAENLPIKNQDISVPLAQLLNDYTLPAEEDAPRLAQLGAYTAHFTVSDQEIPTLRPRAMKRLQLIISWSDDPLDAVEMAYFLPNEANEA